jgi:CBS domain containing-hemolysin-like protein
MEGLLTIHDAHVDELKTPFEKINSILSMDTILDEDKINQIRSEGFSRIPVSSDRDNKNMIIGILLAKSLIGLPPSDLTIFDQLNRKRIKVIPPLYISKDVPMSKLIEQFQHGSSHMAVVLEDDK